VDEASVFSLSIGETLQDMNAKYGIIWMLWKFCYCCRVAKELSLAQLLKEMKLWVCTSYHLGSYFHIPKIIGS
jgi:hypothetical protein